MDNFEFKPFFGDDDCFHLIFEPFFVNDDLDDIADDIALDFENFDPPNVDTLYFFFLPCFFLRNFPLPPLVFDPNPDAAVDDCAPDIDDIPLPALDVDENAPVNIPLGIVRSLTNC
ncbi:hypothetical protein DERP_009232 [Dermatophagoides pteronyssinus]|uniref:Uncharacterized protein n=1 Tax=Dermatophagoides pteronyssinus TaxID=6956 RepID=A0ABQ8JRH7_DERPT|nr:hypothetical protein DERP_009232 [Dermatophagoides pteronyssinus]